MTEHVYGSRGYIHNYTVEIEVDGEGRMGHGADVMPRSNGGCGGRISHKNCINIHLQGGNFGGRSVDMSPPVNALRSHIPWTRHDLPNNKENYYCKDIDSFLLRLPLPYIALVYQ